MVVTGLLLPGRMGVEVRALRRERRGGAGWGESQRRRSMDRGIPGLFPSGCQQPPLDNAGQY